MSKKESQNKKNLPIAKVYDAIAESFNLKRKKTWLEVDKFITNLSRDNLTLDLGCGNGRYSRLLLEKSIKTVGLDISYKIIKVAQKNELKDFYEKIVGLINSDAKSLPFKDNTFDSVLLVAVIHHFEKEEYRTMLLKEINRILKEKGLCLISCWQKTHPRFKKKDLIKSIKEGKKEIYVPWLLSDGQKIMRYYYLFDIEELVNIVIDSGFNIVQKEIANHNLYMIIEKE